MQQTNKVLLIGILDDIVKFFFHFEQKKLIDGFSRLKHRDDVDNDDDDDDVGGVVDVVEYRRAEGP